MKRHSLFGSFALIAIGTLWILNNINVINTTNFWALAYFWPILLIALGFGLILRSRLRAASFGVNGVSALVILSVMAAIIFAPQLGWNKAPGWIDATEIKFMGSGGRLSGSGNVLSETRPVQDFTAITVNFPAEIVIQTGESNSLTIQADDNLLPQLTTQVTGGRLVIENNQGTWIDKVNPTKHVIVTITVKDLHELDFHSAGSVLIDGLQTDKLIISLNGAGKINLTRVNITNLNCDLNGVGELSADGRVETLDLFISGVGSFLGADLASHVANVSVSGAGSVTVWVENNLNVGISGAGSVNYYGRPYVSKNISGLGTVRRLGDK